MPTEARRSIALATVAAGPGRLAVIVEAKRRWQVVAARRALLRRLERRDVVVRAHVERNAGGDAVDRQHPRELLVLSELFRHGEDEHAVAASGEEVRRLAQIGIAGFEMIGRADRDVDLTRRIAIEITNQKAVRAVGIVVPAFVGRRHARAESLRRRAREQRLCRECRRAGGHAE